MRGARSVHDGGGEARARALLDRGELEVWELRRKMGHAYSGKAAARLLELPVREVYRRTRSLSAKLEENSRAAWLLAKRFNACKCGLRVLPPAESCDSCVTSAADYARFGAVGGPSRVAEVEGSSATFEIGGDGHYKQDANDIRRATGGRGRRGRGD